jgi:hypothetical protein
MLLTDTLTQTMPTRIEVLPEDIQTIIYKELYSSILCDMRREAIYKNAKHFHKLLEITSDPFVYDLDYLGMLNINNIYHICKYKYNNCYELFQPETAIYQRSHFTKPLEISLNSIEISNEPFYNLYKSNKRYYWRWFAKEYITQLRIRKGTFIFQQLEPFSCMAELLYNVIDFYNCIRNIIYAYIHELESLAVLTQRQRKDKYILEDIFNYHINNRFIIRFDYDIDTATAYPILLPY